MSEEKKKRGGYRYGQPPKSGIRGKVTKPVTFKMHPDQHEATQRTEADPRKRSRMIEQGVWLVMALQAGDISIEVLNKENTNLSFLEK